jgi:hypothetical protein
MAAAGVTPVIAAPVMLAPQKDDVPDRLKRRCRVLSLRVTYVRIGACTLALLALCGCSGGFGGLSDLSIKDQEWLSRPRLLNKIVSIDSPPLNPTGVVPAEDLITADGACPGLSAAPATALSDDQSAVPQSTGRGGNVALGHTECDVARAIGVPDNVNLSANPRGDRVAVLTYSRGGRAGIYTFTAGRLTSIEKGPEAAPEPKPARKPKGKRAA